MKSIDREILRIALPSIVSNITVPLLGLVDVTIVGHLGSPAYIGAIAVGGMLFNIIYWLFAFLRMGTSGMTSQAYGRQDQPEILRLLVRSVGLGVLIAVLLIILQMPIVQGAFLFIHPTEEIRELATTYFRICIWGAPAMLGLYGLTGWYIGMQNSRIPMAVAITQNVVNIAASLSFVYWGGMKVEGVALGTLVAQWAGFAMGLGLWFKYYGHLRRFRLEGLWQREAMKRFFAVNRDIFLRTLCLVDYIGAHNPKAFQSTVRHLFLWGGMMVLLFTGMYALGGNAFLSLLTDEPEVIAASGDYFFWALLIPIAGMAAFVWDGVFIGATATRGMLTAMAVAALCFFGLYYGWRDSWGNHALWLAFVIYLAMRGAVQTGLARNIMRKSFTRR